MNTLEDNNNRNKIIEIATKIFYEKGYDKTSFSAIAKYCDITKGLITYHFGTKSNLAKEVVLNYNIHIKNNVEAKIYNNFTGYNQYYSTVAELLIIFELYNNDKKALDFYLEYLNSGFESQFFNGYMNFYTVLDRHDHLEENRNPNKFKILSTASMFSGLSLFYSFYTGKLECSYEEYTNHSLQVQLKILNIKDKNIDLIIEEGKKIVNQLDYQLLPYFKVL